MIPIENIYFLLCYAWDKLEQRHLLKAGVSGQKSIYELLGSILVRELPTLWKKGYFKNYTEQNQYIQGIRGKVHISPSLATGAFEKGMAYCEFDEFSENILANQILKSSLVRLLKVSTLSEKVHQSLYTELRRLHYIQEISLHEALFRQAFAQCHRNTTYTFLLHICELLYSQSMVSEQGESILFRDFEQDDRKMAGLFEAFVRNFYKIELKSAKVFRERLQWKLTGTEPQYLPKMQTDISLILNDGKKLIIDTKYYARTLNTYFSSEKIHTENLYQLFAYLKNQPDEQAEGILLYPTVKQSLSLSYTSEQHQIHIETINLAQPWEKIHEDLLEIVTKNLPQTPYSFD